MNAHLPHVRARVVEMPIPPGIMRHQSRTFCQTVRGLTVIIPGCPDLKTSFDDRCPCQGHLTSPCASARRQGE